MSGDLDGFINRHYLLSVVVFVIIALSVALSPSLKADQKNISGKFDYYALALSWSPTYCAGRRSEEKNNRRDIQCTGTRSYAFILHGLWPQYRQGWPAFCPLEKSWVPRHLIDNMLDIMPSRGLIIHQWKKHGSCSGLEPLAYYRLARRLYDKVKIPARYLQPTRPIVTRPEQIESDFLKTNPWLKADMISIVCGRQKRLREIRICFSRAHEPTACSHNQRQGRLCRLKRIIMPPVR